MKSITINLPDEAFEWILSEAKKDYRDPEDWTAALIQKERDRRATNRRTQKAFYERRKAERAK